uniref:Uncharacterized protein n=1 Tax=Quercus lobata TaxID=97700 RepID=A0A7N2R295_QUELO
MVGITIAARKYDFTSAAPFQTSDIMNLQPVVKHSVPLCSEAKDLLETGKVQLAEGMLSEAYTLFSEAFSILQQVTGPMHWEVANCFLSSRPISRVVGSYWKKRMGMGLSMGLSDAEFRVTVLAAFFLALSLHSVRSFLWAFSEVPSRRYLAMVLYHAGDMATVAGPRYGQEQVSNTSPQKLDRSSRTVAVQTPAHRHPTRLAPHRRSVQSQSRAHRRSSEIARTSRRTSLDGHYATLASAFTLLASPLGCSGAPSSFRNMALFYHGLNQTELALRHMSQALLLLSLSLGPDHPDVAATFINVATMYQDIGNMNTALSLRYLQEALKKKNKRLLGEEHIQTAICYHALAIAFNCVGAFKLSHQHEKKTYDILVKQLGEEDSRTRDSQNWMKTFKMRELQMNAQKQKGQALNAASAQKAIDILKAHPDLIQAFQATTTARGSGGSGTSVNKSLNAAIIGDNPPRGRGVDERAARAAAEVRKKAAARGLLIRPHGKVGETDGVKKEANGHPSNGPVDSKNDELTSWQEDQAPVGLGTGLAALDAKKQKAKAKAAA